MTPVYDEDENQEIQDPEDNTNKHLKKQTLTP
jgi:hypothetical protein